MKTSFNLNYKETFVLVIGLALALAGCGKGKSKGSEVTVSAAGASAPTSQWPTSGNVISQCVSLGGTLIASDTLCKIQLSVYPEAFYYGQTSVVDSEDNNYTDGSRVIAYDSFGQAYPLRLEPGNRIKLNTMGSYNNGTSYSFSGVSTTRGLFRKGALIARVGGQYLNLGGMAEQVITDSGELHIGVNHDRPYGGAATGWPVSTPSSAIKATLCLDNAMTNNPCP